MLFWWTGKQNKSDEIYSIINLLSSQNPISPNNFSPESHIKVTRIKEMIANKRSSGLLGKIVFIHTLGNIQRTVQRICILMLRCKGFRGTKTQKNKKQKKQVNEALLHHDMSFVFYTKKKPKNCHINSHKQLLFQSWYRCEP